MDRNVFDQSSLDYALGVRPSKQPEKPKPYKEQLEAIASKHNVPVNVLAALDETSGATDIAQAEANATEIANKVSAGKTIEDAVNERFGKDIGPRVMSRAYDIADQLYPRDREEPGALSDMARQVAGSFVGAGGSAAKFVGTAADDIAENVLGMEPDADGTVVSRAAQGAADWLHDKGDRLKAGVSQAGREAMRQSQPGGDVFDPSTWTLGDDPSIRGYAMQAADVFGSFLPTVLTGVITKNPYAAAAVGGAIGGGAASEQARDIILDMATTKGPDGRYLIETESKAFRDLRDSGATYEEAVHGVIKEAERQAMRFTTPISALGGAATEKILEPGVRSLAARGVATKVAGKAALSGLEEGSQEAAESIATNYGLNKGAGADRSLTDGTFGDFLLGAIGGAVPGAAAGAFARPEDEQTNELQGDGASPALEGTAPASPPSSLGAGAVAQPISEPTGPITEAAGVAPPIVAEPDPLPQKFPDQKPGNQLRLQTPDGLVTDAVFISENPANVIVRIAGDEIAIDHADFDKAMTGGRLADEAAKKLQKQQDAAAKKAGKGKEVPQTVQDPAPLPSPAPADPLAAVPVPTQDAPAIEPGPLAESAQAHRPNPEAISPEEAKRRMSNIEAQAAKGGWNKRLKKLHENLARFAEPPVSETGVAAPVTEPPSASVQVGSPDGVADGVPLTAADAPKFEDAPEPPHEAPQDAVIAALKEMGHTDGPWNDARKDDVQAEVIPLKGKSRDLARFIVRDGGDKGWSVGVDYEIQGFAGGLLGTSPNQKYDTREDALRAAYDVIHHQIGDVAEGRAGSASPRHVREAKRILKWAKDTTGGPVDNGNPPVRDTQTPLTAEKDTKVASAAKDETPVAPAAEAGDNARRGPFKLADRLDAKEQKDVAKWRDADLGELFGQLDDAARRAEAQARAEDSPQARQLVEEAVAHAKAVIAEAKKAKTGALPFPNRDEDTGEWEFDEDSATSDALQWLDTFDSMGTWVDTIDPSGQGSFRGDEQPVQMDPAAVFPLRKGTVNLDQQANRGGFMPLDEATARLAFWKKTAKDIGATGANKQKAIISLFDYTGAWAQPWLDAGYQVLRFDIKTGSDILTDDWFWNRIVEIRQSGIEVYGLLSACPCTTFAGSGARWWEGLHDAKSPDALKKVFGERALSSGAKSPVEYNVMLADATRDAVKIAAPTGFHVLENPIGRIETAAKMPKPVARFHPYNFGDPYTKFTQLFGEFRADLPFANVDPVEGSKMQSKYRGDDPMGKEARSTTPEGFAYAFFMANDPEARKVKDQEPPIPRKSSDTNVSDTPPRPAPEIKPAGSPAVQPDLLGDSTKTETELALAERRKREWGQYLAIAENAKSTWDGQLEAAQVYVNKNRVTITTEKGSRTTDTDGMSRSDISGWSRWALKQVDGFAPAPKPVDAQAAAVVPTAKEVTAAAKEADRNPTDGQKEAGNYKMGHIAWNGLDITIETAKGAYRRGKDSNGEEWSVKLPAHYGYIKRTEGADGDHVDVYMGPNPESDSILIVDQIDLKTRKFDEHKVMLGFNAVADAKAAYEAGFSDGKGGLRRGGTMSLNVDQFKAWLKHADMTKRANEITHRDLNNWVAQDQGSESDKAKDVDASPASGTGLRVFINKVGKDGLTDAERAAGQKPLSDPEPPARPKMGDPGYTLADAEADLAAVRAEYDAQGMIKNARTGDQMRKLQDLVKQMKDEVAAKGKETTTPDDPATKPLSVLSQAEQDRAALLRARIAERLKTQMNSGIDPELIRDAVELVGIYIKAGIRKFRAMVDQIGSDMGLTAKEAEPWVRAAYNQARDDMELADEDVSDMDDAKAVLAEVKNIRAEASKKSEDNATLKPSDDGGLGVSEGQHQTVDTGSLGDEEAAPGSDTIGQGDSEPLGGRGSEAGDGDQDGARDNLAGSLVGNLDGDPVVAEAEGDEDTASEPQGERSGVSPGNFSISADFPLGEGTDGEKIAANLAAIRLVKTLERENRFATKDEQSVLARYVGWGGLKRVFDPREKESTGQFGRAQRELRETLTPKEYRAAARSTADAHYTSRAVVNAMWDAMRSFGFDGGRVLEPTIGTGNFVGLQPEDLAAKSEWFAAELDAVTGAIAKHLYPDATVFAATGFQNAPFRAGTIDVAIGNPPFGPDIIESDLHPELPPLSVHNYIIAKTGLLLRPGGIMGMVVTSRFLDTANPQARSYLAEHFNFLGAVRLPNTAFKANAGTEVTTDIVWFQKRREGDPKGAELWLDTDKSVGDVKVNGYFAAHPDMMLGKPGMDGTMYGGKEEFTLHDDGRDLAEALLEAHAKLKASLPDRETALADAVVAETMSSDLAYGETKLLDDGRVVMRFADDAAGNAVVAEVTEKTIWGDEGQDYAFLIDQVEAARDKIKTGTVEEAQAAAEGARAAIDATAAFTAAGGKRANPKENIAAVYDLADGLFAEKPYFGPKQAAALKTITAFVDKRRIGPKKLAALRGLMSLRRNARELLAAENANDPAMEAKRKALREEYRSFVKANGYINNKANDRLVNGIPGIEAALEIGYRPADKARGTSETAKEASILHERIIKPLEAVKKVGTAADGIHVSLQKRGRLDVPFIAQITGLSTEQIIADLTKGEHPQAFFDPERSEFQIADEYLSGNIADKIEAAKRAGRFENVKHLEAAMPAPKAQSQITPAIRSLWMPESVFRDFLRALGATSPKVHIDMRSGSIEVDEGANVVLTDLGRQFRTERKEPFDIFAAAVRGKSIVVYDRLSNGSVVKNEKETQDANAAVDRMAAEFKKWAYLNPERASLIVDAFNTKMNVIVPRKFDGVRYLTQVGNNPAIKMRNSQKNGAWRMMLSDSTLLHHVVGAGKTFTAITAIMERKRLGLSNKSLVAVPNHLVAQWARDFYALYPGANILAATEDDFKAKNRRKLIGRIATGNFDAVIIGHSALKHIPNSIEDTQALAEEQIQDLESSLNEAKTNGSSRATVAQIQKRIDKYQERLSALLETLKGDTIGFDFTQMGLDNLVIDEAHEFKNLEYSSAADRLVGMNSPEGSQRAFDLYLKVRGLKKRKGSIGFLTGTPVSNSLVEIYTVMKYLAPDMLRKMGLMHYDSWASTFVQSKVKFEYTATQKLKERNILAGLVNLGPLADIYRSFADIVMRADVERMYREQIEQENRENGTNLPTRFPTPKVKGGGRRLITIPASPDHEEFTDYLVMRMDGIKKNASNKEYAKRDNALWVLSDARKASIDIRTVDPNATRSLLSKVAVAGDEVLRIAKKWDAKKGTQMVFADGSVPLKTAKADITKVLKAAWEKAGVDKARAKAVMERNAARGTPWVTQWAEARDAVEDRLNSGNLTAAQMDAIEEWLNGEDADEGAAIAVTADSGFSFYDDMRAYLSENGILADQVAFIHDYNTAEQKARLFDAVNAGDVRVLIGSTFKMGAGTNAQQRLVGLHHIDAPWRPSDMEQREGRIIRQGNDLYAEDPDGFEVEILAYATEKTSDTVLWQVLERKAAGIEQFLNASADAIEDDNSDSDSYASFMAQSTGNPVFLEKMETEKELRDEKSAQSSQVLMVAEATNFLSNLPNNIAMAEQRIAAAKTVNFDAYPDAGKVWDDYQRRVLAYETALKAHEDEADRIREANKVLAKGEKRQKLPEFDQEVPTIFPADGVTVDKYSEAIRSALVNAEQHGIEGHIKVGGATIIIDAEEKADGTKFYSADILIDGVREGLPRGTAVVKNPLNARRMIAALMPDAVNDFLKDFVAERVNRIARWKAAEPEMRRRAETKVDQDKIEKLDRRLSMLSGRVRVAEVDAARSRLGKANRFADMDIKDRDLKRETGDDAPLLPTEGDTFTFKNAGVQYAAKFGAKAPQIRQEDGKYADSYWFEGIADDDNQSVTVLRVQRTVTGEGPEATSRLEVVDTYPTGQTADDLAARERRDMAGQAAPMDTAALTAAINDELTRAGVSGRVNARLVQGLVGEQGDQIAGRYSNGSIELNAQSGDVLGTLRHEIVHALRKGFAPGEWQALVRAAKRDPEIKAAVLASYGDKDSEAQAEEMVAELYRKSAAGVSSLGNLNRLIARIAQFVEAVGNALRGNGYVSAASVMQRIARGEVGARLSTEPEGTAQEMRASDLSLWRDALRRFLEKKLNPGVDLRVGRVPQVLRALGVPDRVMVMKANKVGLVLAKHKLLPVEALRDLPNLIADPLVVAAQDGKESDFLLLVEAKSEAGLPVVVAVKAEGTTNKGQPASVVLTVYPLDDAKSRVQHLARQGKILYVRDSDSVAEYELTGASSLRGPNTGLSGNAVPSKILRHSDVFKAPAPREMRLDLVSAKNKALGMVGRDKWRKPDAAFFTDLLNDAMAGKIGPNALSLVPGRALFSELGKALHSARSYLRGKEEMDALRNDWHSKADEVAQEWLTLRRKDPEANERLMDIMHRATMAGVDPSKPDTWKNPLEKSARETISRLGEKHKDAKWAVAVVKSVETHRAAYAGLSDEFATLPPDFKALFGKVAANYSKMGDDFEKAVFENMRNAQRIALKRAERMHRKELQRIEDEGLEGKERDEAIEEADKALDRIRQRSGWGMNARIAHLRKSFESNKLKGPYFPLARFGKFFVTVRDSKGKVVSFSRFEKSRDQKRFAAEAEKDHPGKVQVGIIGDGKALRDQVDPAFVADVQSLLGDAGADGALMDAVWQRWLETLPDQSIRTSRIHRKGTAGYSGDAYRAFGHHMFHGAHQLARLQYGLALEEALNDAEEEAAKADDPVRAGFVVDEMRKRHEFTMNPVGGPVAAKMGGLAFVWYLAATPGAAIANLTQTSVVGIPVMAAKFRQMGVMGVSRALGKALKDFTAARGDMEHSDRLNAREKLALLEAVRRGTIDRTQAHDLAGVAETGIEYSGARERVMKKLSFFFHHAERLNREITFLAAYRLAIASGEDHGRAIETAADMTWKVHFDYQATSRPRIMQNDLMKVLTTFRQFTVNMLWRLFRDAHQSFKGASAEDRAEARAQLIGITLSMMAHAGIRGTWGFGILMTLLGLFFPGGADDAEEWLQDALLMEGDDLGTATWNYAMGAAMNGAPGQVFGLDLKERIGMPNLWFRSPSKDLEGEDLYNFWVSEIGGPVLAVGESWFRGVSMLAEGNLWRGTETLLPKAARDLMKAARYSTEGVKTLNGDDILENVNPYQALVQAAGFTPAKIAERYEINNRLVNEEKRIMAERKAVHRAATDAILAGEAMPQSVMDQIREFNAKYPEYPITTKTIKQSLSSRQNMAERKEFGVALNEKLDARIRGDRPPAYYN